MAIRIRTQFSPTAAAMALLFAPLAAQAQSAPQSLKSVTVVGKSAPVLDAEQADVGGFGLSLGSTPQGISVLGADLLAATGTASLSHAVKLDASLADSYNTTGYVESLSVRGFLLDQGNNFLRNGLPSSNFAPLALENKERIEVLKGVSGMQAGVSAPGGLLNFVTKQPLREPFTQLVLGTDGNGGSKVHLDTNVRWGPLGVRVNLANESLRTHFDRADGQRSFASVALATDLSTSTAVSADLELHRKRQPSVPGLGLRDTNGDGLGDSPPLRINPRLNLNNQTWSLPFESTTTAAQLAVKHRLNANWQALFALGMQRIRIDDRLAFPDGCSSAANYVYPGLCANGDVDVYDYRSEGEERTVASWDLRLNGKFSALGTTHQLLWGLGGHRSRLDLQPLQAYNYVGTTNIDAPIALPADATPSELNSPSSENVVHSTVSLVTELGPRLKSFVGWRVSQVERKSARSDGSRAVALDQNVSTPWVGLTWTVKPSTVLYASWGQGAELEVVPNRSNRFVNYGQVLPALKSEQTELGLKWQLSPRLLLTAAAFSIDKPFADDVADASGLPLRVAGAKTARHRGLELGLGGRVSEPLSVQASVAVLDAQWTRAVDPGLEGQRVTNVPRLKTSLFVDYKFAAVPGFALNALLSSESGKTVLPDGSMALPDAWQLDAGVRYQHQLRGKAVQWRLHMENLTDRTYWREAPTQYWGGIYLFPSTPRTLRATVTLDL